MWITYYEYDHKEEWAKTRKHEENNLTLLCDRHLKEKTIGLITKQRIIDANKNPFNILNRIVLDLINPLFFGE